MKYTFLALRILFVIGIIVVLNKPLSQTATAQTGKESVQNQKRTPKQQTSLPSSTNASTPNSKPLPTDKFIVKIKAASGDVWMKYKVDKGNFVKMVLRQGQTEEIPPARNMVTINFGNRQVLELFINNKSAYFPNDTPKFMGQVIISKDNLQAFFKQPASLQ
jgi:hypothetical protein